MVDKYNSIDESDFDFTYEKLFMPENYSDKSNYTIDKAFAISNEHSEHLFKPFNLKGKKVLTVGSSGDQALNVILKGSKDITIIDANIFTRPFIEYKFAVIKTFDYKTFSKIFIKPEFFSWKVYSKISHLLSKNVQTFFDTLMLDLSEDNYSNEFNARKLKEKMLFVDHRDRHSSFYKNELTYNKLQTLLNKTDVNISFITAELQKFPNVLKSKYDIIYLSNIFDYYKGSKAPLFEKVLNKIYQNNLATNGKLFANYSFCEKIEDSPKQISGLKINHLKINRFLDGEMNQDIAWIVEKKPLNKNEICK